MKSLLLAIPVCLMAINAFAGTVALRSASASYTIETVSNELPQSIKDQVIASNKKAKETAVQQAVQKLEDTCIDKHWPSPNQMDIASISTSQDQAVSGGYSYTVTVEAICRSN